MESDLTCPICLDFYTDPVALYCMHSFCRDCLLEHLRTSSPSLTKDEDKIQVPCPNCKKVFPMSISGIRGKQRNFQLQSIVESYKKNQGISASSSVPCDFCKDSVGRPAIKRCTKCEVSYCEPCVKVYHPPRGPLATHTFTNINGGASGGAANLPKPRLASGTQSGSSVDVLKVGLGL